MNTTRFSKGLFSRFLTCFILLSGSVALARAGGGQNYQQGSSSSGTGGSGGWGEISFSGVGLEEVWFGALFFIFGLPAYGLLRTLSPRNAATGKPLAGFVEVGTVILGLFIFAAPTQLIVLLGILCWMALPPVFLIATGLRYLARKRNADKPPPLPPLRTREVRDPTEKRVSRVTALDENFSLPVFRDFCVLLFTRCLQRGAAEGNLSLYLSDAALAQQRPEDSEILNAVVGQTSISWVTAEDRGLAEIGVSFEAVCLTKEKKRYSREENWTFQKRANVLSPAPEIALKLGCPNCGARDDCKQDGVCAYCGQKVNDGRFGWTVSARRIVRHESLPPLELSASGIEHGTSLQTLVSPDLSEFLSSLQSRDSGFNEKQFRSKVEDLFSQVNAAWSRNDQSTLRRLETVSLYNTHRFWLERYEAEGFRNELSRVQVHRVELVKGSSDKFYDILTSRITASMVDVTVESSTGRVVSGDKVKPQLFSEYWTLLRKHDYQETTDEGCPNCGAELKVDEGGCCTYCEQSLVTGGYGWVLAEITQDEEYSG